MGALVVCVLVIATVYPALSAPSLCTETRYNIDNARGSIAKVRFTVDSKILLPNTVFEIIATIPAATVTRCANQSTGTVVLRPVRITAPAAGHNNALHEKLLSALNFALRKSDDTLSIAFAMDVPTTPATQSELHLTAFEHSDTMPAVASYSTVDEPTLFRIATRARPSAFGMGPYFFLAKRISVRDQVDLLAEIALKPAER